MKQLFIRFKKFGLYLNNFDKIQYKN